MRCARSGVPSGVRRRAFLLAPALLGCTRRALFGPGAPSSNPAAGAAPEPASYDALLASIEARRRATSDPARARAVLRAAIVDEIIPRWLGTRWAFEGTATRPHAAEGIACGYFVATVLEAAGLRLESRARFGQATALAIQRALVAAPDAHHRVFSVPPAELVRRLRAWGDGLYVIGLDVHVGFVAVEGATVRLLHSSYTGARVVTDEPVATARAIERSRAAGYFVTSLFGDDALARTWLAGRVVRAPR